MTKQLTFTVTFISIIFIISGCSKGSSGGGDPTPPQTNPCATSLLFISSISLDPTPPQTNPCATLSFKFAADVKPIIDATCAINSGCHATGSTNKGGALTDYNKIFVKRADIKSQIEAGLMPQTGSLTADQKNKIICWINSGAPNN